MIIRDIRGKKSSSALVSAPQAQSDWVYALKDVSFEVKRWELRTLRRSEKEISKKCLGATKVPDSGRRRHQLLGIIGRNGAGKSTLLKILSRVTTQARKRLGRLLESGKPQMRAPNCRAPKLPPFCGRRRALGRKSLNQKIAQHFRLVASRFLIL